MMSPTAVGGVTGAAGSSAASSPPPPKHADKNNAEAAVSVALADFNITHE
jgi:hypothetical protein